MRSVKRVSQKVNPKCSGGQSVFNSIAYHILKVKDGPQVDILFGILKGSHPLEDANQIIPPKTFPIGYAARHNLEKWKGCQHWVDWWMQDRHLSKNLTIILIHIVVKEHLLLIIS